MWGEYINEGIWREIREGFGKRSGKEVGGGGEEKGEKGGLGKEKESNLWWKREKGEKICPIWGVRFFLLLLLFKVCGLRGNNMKKRGGRGGEKSKGRGGEKSKGRGGGEKRVWGGGGGKKREGRGEGIFYVLSFFFFFFLLFLLSLWVVKEASEGGGVRKRSE